MVARTDTSDQRLAQIARISAPNAPFSQWFRMAFAMHAFLTRQSLILHPFFG